MKRPSLLEWIVAIAIVILLGWMAWTSPDNLKPQKPSGTPTAPALPPPPRSGYIGGSILKDYAAPNRSIEDDLTDLSHALKNFALLVKGSDPIPLGANDEIALALLGKNRARLAFLPKDSQALNAQGQLIDRWGTPLWFHASTRERIDIRSAGQDQKLWTTDDVHRRHDGRFLKSEELNPRSLNDALK